MSNATLTSRITNNTSVVRKDSNPRQTEHSIEMSKVSTHQNPTSKRNERLPVVPEERAEAEAQESDPDIKMAETDPKCKDK